jgi:hypothetical protein
MAENLLPGRTARKLSEFYILLWAELASLTDEYRWLEPPTDAEPIRNRTTILAELETYLGRQAPTMGTRLRAELDRTQNLKSLWIDRTAEDRMGSFQRIEEAKKAYVDSGLGLGLWASRYLTAFVFFKTKPGGAAESADELRRLGGVREVHLLTGAYDGVAVCQGSDEETVGYVVSKIRSLKNIREITVEQSRPSSLTI